MSITKPVSAAQPRLRLPWSIIPSLGIDVFRGEPRSLAADARAMVARMQPLPRVTGVRNIPASASFVLVANHFEGPGLWIGWSAALLTHAVARARPSADSAPLHWLVEADMDRARVAGWKKLVPGTAWAFGRVARVWGLVAIPRPESPPAHRVAAVRRLVQLASPPQGAGAPVGFFPEGEGAGLDGLRRAPDAAGSLLALLGKRGVPTVPAAVWLEDGRLTARIGEPWLVQQRGAAGATEAMVRIGRMLPPHLHGDYASELRV